METLEYYGMPMIIQSTRMVQHPYLKRLVYIYFFRWNVSTASMDHLLKKCHFFTKEVYRRRIHVDKLNQYTVLSMNLPVTSLETMVKQCLRKVIQSKLVCLEDTPIQMKDCLVLDVLQSSISKFNHFHTDIEYCNFTGNAFNVWYLIENPETFGNMFLAESDEYKMEYTPCYLSYDYENGMIPVHRQSYFSSVIHPPRVGYIREANLKITYTNINNGECLIMSPHVLHRTDLKRTSTLKGFNFRVILKNKDGSINYKNTYSKIKPYHLWDQENQKIYGCRLMDFA